MERRVEVDRRWERELEQKRVCLSPTTLLSSSSAWCFEHEHNQVLL